MVDCFSGLAFHLAIVSGVGELPTSWLPQTQTIGMAGSSLLYTFFRSASCRARISGNFSPKASTRSPQTTKNAGLGCMLLRISTLFLHNSTLDDWHHFIGHGLPPSPTESQGKESHPIRPFQNCTLAPIACQLPEHSDFFRCRHRGLYSIICIHSHPCQHLDEEEVFRPSCLLLTSPLLTPQHPFVSPQHGDRPGKEFFTEMSINYLHSDSSSTPRVSTTLGQWG